MTTRRWIETLALLFVAALVWSGMAWSKAQALRAAPDLPVLGTVPPFSLIDQDGQAVTAETLRGSVWVADFIFTRCSGQCPMMQAQLAALAGESAANPSITFVSFSVDPEHDTAPVLAQYASAYTKHAGRWRFLTGERQAIVRLCIDGFHLSASDEPSAPEAITHSSRFVLVDRQGRIRGYYDSAEASQLQQLRRDLDRAERDAS